MASMSRRIFFASVSEFTGIEVWGFRRHREVRAVGFEVLSPGVHDPLEELVLVDRSFDFDDPLAGELPRHGPGFGDRAGVSREDVPELGARSIGVVGGRLDDARDAVGAVTLVTDRLVAHTLKFAGTALDRALDRVQGYRRLAGLLVHGAQRRVGVDVAAAFSGSDFDLADQLGEDLGASAVFGALAVFGRCPLRMAGHVPSSTRLGSITLSEIHNASTKRRWIRSSFVSSGWKEQPQIRFRRTSTGCSPSSRSSRSGGRTHCVAPTAAVRRSSTGRDVRRESHWPTGSIRRTCPARSARLRSSSPDSVEYPRS